MATTTQGDILKSADIMLDGVSRNELDPSISLLAFQLGEARAGAKEALARRALGEAQSQRASRDLDGFVVTIKVVYSRLRRMLQGNYGVRDEKLAEFGIQPLRPVPKAKSTPQSPEQAQSAKQATTPAADSTN
ncbi:MAG TPA: hypothetical protein VE078_15090 [Thermoanaerobaculia bacterium]|nr:hypothetical protein [Thermoanaerobaculia bacterium]